MTLSTVLVATMRDEGPFLLEWAAYHLAIGFAHLVVGTNDCTDGSPDLLDRLAQFAPLTHMRNSFAPDEKPQLAAYARAAELPVVRAADWLMVLDADEFLNVHVGEGRVTDLLAAAPQTTAFLVNWRIFGSSGHEDFKPAPVLERFTRAAPLDHGVNLSFKTLYRGVDLYHCPVMPHQPRFPRDERQKRLVYVDGGGRALPDWYHDETRGDFLQSEPGTVSWQLAQVNHYNTRSRADYRVKHHRGGGLNILWERDEWWPVFDRNEERDLSIQRHLPAVRAVLDQWMKDAELRRLHERCCRLYADHAAKLAVPE
jgi:hypothetical protein